MYVYVILETYDKGNELERFSEKKWNEVKDRLNPLRIIHISRDLNDDRFKDYEYIVWDRIFNPLLKIYEKIIVPFSTDFIENCKKAEAEKNRKLKIIEERVEQKKINRAIRINRKRERNMENGNYERLRQVQEEMSRLIPSDMDEMEAFATWKSLDYRRPAGNRIEQIRKEYNMPWNSFIRFIDTQIFAH